MTWLAVIVYLAAFFVLAVFGFVSVDEPAPVHVRTEITVGQ